VLRHALGLLLALALGLAPARASAELYRWVDELGVTHYTTDPDEVPRKFRSTETTIPTTRPRARARAPQARPAPTPTPTPKPEVAATAPASTSAPATEPAPQSVEPSAPALAAPPLVAPPPDAPQPTPEAPAAETSTTPTAPTVFPGPPSTGALPPDDPRAVEVAALEAQIATDRESLRQIISTKRWDSAELTSDPQIREIAERLPRLQAQLEALRAESVP